VKHAIGTERRGRACSEVLEVQVSAPESHLDRNIFAPAVGRPGAR
jgi:hypothetical protein